MYVLMMVPSNFPNGDAGAVRDMAFGAIYQDLGFEAILLGRGKESKFGKYQGITYRNFCIVGNGICKQIRRCITSQFDYIIELKKISKEKGKPVAIHVNGGSFLLLKYLKYYSKKYGIPILHDSTEWYSACEFKKGKRDKSYILKDLLNTKWIDNPIRVIAISTYLEEHFLKRGIRTKRIPVIMDVQDTLVDITTESDIIKLIYAGSPAKKDYLKEIVIGVEELNDTERSHIQLNIFGATAEQISAITGLNKLSKSIIAHGRVPREKVTENLVKSDFSVLLRPEDERYAKAGFPTKSVEAMTHGIPMICNLTSDLGMYLVDMENAIIVNGHTANDFSEAVRRVILLNRNQIIELKKNARQTAEENFDYRQWIHTIKDLLDSE